MALPTLYAMKKTFYYNFFPTKEEDDLLNSTKDTAGGSAPVVWPRKMVEIRDIYPPPVVDPANPWVIKKIITPHEVASGILVLSAHDVFEHVIRYWDLDTANYLAIGRTVSTVGLWDATEERNPKIYWVYFQMMDNEDCVLWCMNVVYKSREVKLYDEIQMYWDSVGFKFRIVS